MMISFLCSSSSRFLYICVVRCSPVDRILIIPRYTSGFFSLACIENRYAGGSEFRETPEYITYAFTVAKIKTYIYYNRIFEVTINFI